MTITFPAEIYTHIFSFLDPRSLGRAGRVCRLWRDLLNSETVQRYLCLATLKNAQPCPTWTARFKVLRNIMKGSYTRTHLPVTCEDFIQENHDSFALDGSIPWDLVVELPHATAYFARNCVTGNTPHRMNIQAPMVSEDFHNTTWAVLNAQSAILCFDLRTGECLHRLNLDQHSAINQGKIQCTESEIITFCGRELQIWHRASQKLQQVLVLPEKSTFVACTPHHIILSRQSTLVAIHRSTTHETTLCKGIPIATACVDSYFAFVSASHVCTVFKDMGSQLIQLPTQCDVTIVRIYQNWLLGKKGTTLNIWDIETGELISFLELPAYTRLFQTNGSQIIARVAKQYVNMFKGISTPSRTTTYTRLDFQSTI